ncbi:TadE/TadG family type IV pilus assembly protein [Chenggangzhangella methanolivorans]|uniref:Pilus assembly protein n=1 Tax=Chenggangzhangella methanolivorans TaxID=1437009 RepID=A0A9E6RF87_9HYPH|nr:TadE/TadG family type IV pilus assembly protein [Chenggangzhangella methanolivorans]QZN99871.1 pilus assembly protein [Chenggangzhangella methanolivorans]
MTPARFGKIARFNRDARGVTMVEFGLIAPVLTLMIMGIVELGLMMAGQAVLDNATFVASRIGKTGYETKDKKQDKQIAEAIQKAASSYLDPNKIIVTSTAYSDYDSMKPEPFTDTNKNGVRDAGEPFVDVNGNGSYDTNVGSSGYGASGQVVLYTATYNWTLFTPMIGRLIGKNNVVPLQARVVVKNEPF